MRKTIWNILKLSPVIVAATFFSANGAIAEEINEQVTPVAELSEETSPMGQVTSVSQFSDVQPTDWAFQALQSLVERYGCIAGYPNGTYRGNRALTRYEFAAGLNACLDRVNELIATATANIVTKEDLATLQRLQEEFSAELATLRGRVDAVEARTAEIEANQFSTTAKLNGEVIFALSQAFGDQVAGSTEDLDTNTTFTDRVRLNIDSSFTGSDRLRVRLEARNVTQYNTSRTGTNMTRLGFDGEDDNDFEIGELWYEFPLGDALRVHIDAVSGEYNDNINNFHPAFESSGGGAISRYGRFSPIYRQGDGAGITLTFAPESPISASVGYLAEDNSNPGLGTGVFNGSYAAIGQVAFQPSKSFGVGLTYARTYQNSQGGVNLFDSTGSAFANNPFAIIDDDGDDVGFATTANHYGVQASVSPSSKFAVSGWAGFTDATAKAGPNAGADAEMFYWAASLALRDLGTRGSTLGIIFGQPPRVTNNDITDREDPNTSYHLEALYKLPINDNIAITPGVLVIFNPEHNNDNDTIYVGTLRTTFKF
ncbi:iron uptake porin [Plectonema cf. radiosum LEGE 06105]|uniref:Iron uptake porin n=1 Tax=Plectonema cf. radiosum LEGE 06105 TaxID=945769 RepID=A0A8J7JRJ5_9CYAN|nr:iron uptake porin [Plectonema radiosum]MBE9211394.1 iron uptake porin [Plectonema cf. radiosum LEGE 06105]